MSNADTGPVEGFVRESIETVHDWAAWSLVRGSFVDPSGDTFSRSFVVSPGAVGIVAILGGADQRMVFVRQYRPALNRMTLEVPAGMRDQEGEDPMITAQRELREEVGVVAGAWQRLGCHVSSPGISNSTVELFLATELSDVDHDRHGPEERHMTVEEHPLNEALAMVMDGRMDDSKTVIGILMAARLLRLG
jgi:ADP-ribose pyrophosphatase